MWRLINIWGMYGCPHKSPHTSQVEILGKIFQHYCGNSFSFLKWSGRGSKGGHWMMVFEYGYEHGYEKERIRELNHRQKVSFSTLLLPVLVAWNTLDTRGSTASNHHIEILKSCNSYHSMPFGSTARHTVTCKMVEKISCVKFDSHFFITSEASQLQIVLFWWER